MKVRFIYRFSAGGGASDSLNRVVEVQTVPAVGDNLAFISPEGATTESEVKEVVHLIDESKKTHEIVVYHGDRT